MNSNKLPLALMFVLAAPVALAAPALPENPNQSAPASQTPAKVELALPVAGLTVENATKTRSVLNALSIETYECPDCGYAQPRAGKCGACELDLEPVRTAVFADVQEAADHTAIALRLAPSAQVRLSTIEKALKQSSVEIRREKLQLGGFARLVYSGGSSSEDALALQKSFRDASLADTEASFDTGSKEIHVHVRKGHSTWAALSELGTKLSKPLRLTDVVWGMPAPVRAS